LVWRLRGIPRKRHYVDGWVMWPAGVFPLLAGVVRAGSGHITRGGVRVNA
jgi:hypothetical protein